MTAIHFNFTQMLQTVSLAILALSPFVLQRAPFPRASPGRRAPAALLPFLAAAAPPPPQGAAAPASPAAEPPPPPAASGEEDEEELAEHLAARAAALKRLVQLGRPAEAHRRALEAAPLLDRLLPPAFAWLPEGEGGAARRSARWVLNNWAVALYLMGEPAAARAGFRRALGLGPRGEEGAGAAARAAAADAAAAAALVATGPPDLKARVDALRNLAWAWQAEDAPGPSALQPLRQAVLDLVADAGRPLPESLPTLSLFEADLGGKVCADPLMANGLRRAGRPPFDPAAAYLDQVKRGLTYFLHGDIPHALLPRVEWDIFYRMRDRQHGVGPADGAYFEPGQTIKEVGALNLVQFAALEVLGRGVAGDWLEAGVWRGGAAALLRAVLRVAGDPRSPGSGTGDGGGGDGGGGGEGEEGAPRRVVLADSFAGIPEGLLGGWAQRYASGYAEVHDTFVRYGLADDDDRVVAVEGPFNATLPRLAAAWPGPGPLRLSLLLADADAYESTVDILVNLYPLLEVGGYLIIDDYHVPECRRAVRRYFGLRGVREPLLPGPTDYVAGCKRDPDRGTPFFNHTIETASPPHAAYLRRVLPERELRRPGLTAEGFRALFPDPGPGPGEGEGAGWAEEAAVAAAG